MRKNQILFFKNFVLYIVLLFFSPDCLVCSSPETKRSVEFFQRVLSSKKGLFFEGATWIKNGQICVEFEKDGHLYTSLIKGKKVYRFSTSSSKGCVETLKHNDFNVFSSDIFSSKQQLKTFFQSVNAKKIKDDIYEEEQCSVYQYKTEKSSKKLIHTLWIWKKAFFPLKIEIVFPSGETVSIFYDNLVINASIPDKRFSIPKYVHF